MTQGANIEQTLFESSKSRIELAHLGSSNRDSVLGHQNLDAQSRHFEVGERRAIHDDVHCMKVAVPFEHFVQDIFALAVRKVDEETLSEASLLASLKARLMARNFMGRSLPREKQK